jgi:RNA polymerase sigma factor (sigma-70 family)
MKPCATEMAVIGREPLLTLTPEQELRLVRRCCLGDKRAWVSFVTQYSSYVGRSLAASSRRVGLLSHPEEIAELEAELFFRLADNGFRRLAQYRARSSLGYWLGRVAQNFVIDRRRGQRRQVSLGDLEEGQWAEYLVSTEVCPESQYRRKRRQKLARQLIDGLPRRDAQLARLLFIRGYSATEAARWLKTSCEAIYARKYRILRRLRQQSIEAE